MELPDGVSGELSVERGSVLETGSFPIAVRRGGGELPLFGNPIESNKLRADTSSSAVADNEPPDVDGRSFDNSSGAACDGGVTSGGRLDC